MSSHLDQIVRKRRLLMALVAEQRAELAVQAIALKQSLAYADLAWRAYRKIKSSPVAAAGLAAALVALGPGKLLRIGYRSGLLIVGLLRLIRIVRALR